jgi:transposase
LPGAETVFDSAINALKLAQPTYQRPPARVRPAAYKQRNTVERAFVKLRQNRAVATRFDKRDFVWRATVDVASIRIWLRNPVP